jgi:hypothetical protein
MVLKGTTLKSCSSPTPLGRIFPQLQAEVNEFAHLGDPSLPAKTEAQRILRAPVKTLEKAYRLKAPALLCSATIFFAPSAKAFA